MILSAHQPAYLPWLGYFDKIVKSDVFIFMDSVQYSKNDFINRNKIKTPHGSAWLTIPVKTKGHISNTIKDIAIDYTKPWVKKHLNAIRINYSKAPNFSNLMPKLEALYEKKLENIAELCWHQLQFWLEHLQVKTKIIKLSELHIHSKKSNLILDLCKQTQSSIYYSGARGKDYLVLDDFSMSGIQVEFQEFTHPEYKQLHGEFEPYLGIIDFCMNQRSIL